MTDKHTDVSSAPVEDQSTGRRGFLKNISGLAMLGAVVVSYGRFATVALEFLYPARGDRQAWQFVASTAGFASGSSLAYRTPRGEKVVITRQAETGEVEDFIALSSTCPHLGCQVHWEAQNDRFFCPCHNGIFDPSGKGIGGPPGDAGQDLPRFPLKIESGVLYIKVPMDKLPS